MDFNFQNLSGACILGKMNPFTHILKIGPKSRQTTADGVKTQL